MSRFNLLDEPWISVVFDEKGSTKEVSLLDFFQNAHHYKDLAGDTKNSRFCCFESAFSCPTHSIFKDLMQMAMFMDILKLDENIDR